MIFCGFDVFRFSAKFVQENFEGLEPGSIYSASPFRNFRVIYASIKWEMMICRIAIMHMHRKEITNLV
jgi:hypothetical protein